MLCFAPPVLHLKAQCHEIFCYFLNPLIEAIWAPDKQVKMVLLKNCFCEEIREISDSMQANTAGSQTRPHMLICRKICRIQSWLTLRRVDSVQANTAWSQTPCRLNCWESDFAQANTAQSFAGTNFFFAGLSLP